MFESITIRIENQGSGGTSDTFFTRLWVDGFVIATEATSGLAASADTSLTASVLVNTIGSNQVKATVDVVVEGNEGNNTRTENWS